MYTVIVIVFNIGIGKYIYKTNYGNHSRFLLPECVLGSTGAAGVASGWAASLLRSMSIASGTVAFPASDWGTVGLVESKHESKIKIQPQYTRRIKSTAFRLGFNIYVIKNRRQKINIYGSVRC